MAEPIAVVAGATGLVGRELVLQLAADGCWGEVRALVRGALPPELAVPRVIAAPVDYEQLHPSASWVSGDHVFCALGTTMRRAGSPAAFRRVDFTYPLTLARAARAHDARHFLLVSALGADATSRLFYNHVKGELESAIIALGFRAVTIARPSLLLGPRAERRIGEELGKALGFLAPPRWRPVLASQVARGLIASARRDEPGVHILENRELRAMPNATA